MNGELDCGTRRVSKSLTSDLTCYVHCFIFKSIQTLLHCVCVCEINVSCTTVLDLRLLSSNIELS